MTSPKDYLTDREKLMEKIEEKHHNVGKTAHCNVNIIVSLLEQAEPMFYTDNTFDGMKKFLTEKFLSLLTSEVEKTEKAYGGCKLCYGKGYSTVRYGYSTAPDFVGDKEAVEPITTHIHYCECDRGKQLKGLFEEQRKALSDIGGKDES